MVCLSLLLICLTFIRIDSPLRLLPNHTTPRPLANDTMSSTGSPSSSSNNEASGTVNIVADASLHVAQAGDGREDMSSDQECAALSPVATSSPPPAASLPARTPSPSTDNERQTLLL